MKECLLGWSSVSSPVSQFFRFSTTTGFWYEFHTAPLLLLPPRLLLLHSHFLDCSEQRPSVLDTLSCWSRLLSLSFPSRPSSYRPVWSNRWTPPVPPPSLPQWTLLMLGDIIVITDLEARAAPSNVIISTTLHSHFRTSFTLNLRDDSGAICDLIQKSIKCGAAVIDFFL